MFLLSDKDYPLSCEVLYKMLVTGLQYEEGFDAAKTRISRVCNQMLDQMCADLDGEAQTKRRKTI